MAKKNYKKTSDFMTTTRERAWWNPKEFFDVIWKKTERNNQMCGMTLMPKIISRDGANDWLSR